MHAADMNGMDVVVVLDVLPFYTPPLPYLPIAMLQRAWFLAPARGGSLGRFVGVVQALADDCLWPCTVAVSVDPAFDPDVVSHFDKLVAADPGHNPDKERPLLVEVTVTVTE